MPRDYSTDFHKTVNAVSATEFPVLLLEIDHDDLLVPIRIVNDNQNITSNGNEYIALAFRAKLPDDKSDGLPRAEISIDNVSKDLVGWLELADGGKGATVRMMQVLRSDPDVIEFDITLNLVNVSMTPLEIKGELTYEDLLNKPGILMEFRPNNSPGLF